MVHRVKPSAGYESRCERLRDQPLLPLRPASSAAGSASLSSSIQTQLPRPHNDRDTPEQRYVRAVLERYLWLPDTPTVTSRHDRRLGKKLFERGVSLIVVEAALLLAGARRALREPWLEPLPQVRALAYYQPVVAEVLANPRPPDIDYLTCLLRRLRPLAELKAARLHHHDAAHSASERDTNQSRPIRRSARGARDEDQAQGEAARACGAVPGHSRSAFEASTPLSRNGDVESISRILQRLARER